MMSPQMASQGGAPRRVTPLLVVVSVLVVIVLVLSVVAAFYAVQAEDYHDAKYRAQYVLVVSIVDGIPAAADSIDDMLDTDMDNGFRRSAAKYAQATLEGVADACHGIQVMYPYGHEQNTAFGSLVEAFSAFANATEDGYEQLTDPTPELSEDLRLSLSEAVQVAGAISLLVNAGIVSGVDWMECPYDLVSGMNLVAIMDQAEALIAVL